MCRRFGHVGCVGWAGQEPHRPLLSLRDYDRGRPGQRAIVGISDYQRQVRASLTTLGDDVKSSVEDVLHNANVGEGREPLNRDRICEAALEVIDEVGLESVSMRMLANTLGVKASSLYYHFGSKDELMVGVAEFLYRTLGRPPGGGDWDDQMKGTFLQLRDFIETHPNATPLLVRDLAYSPVAKKRANALVRIACRAGLDSVASASLISNLVALLVGHSLLSLWVREEMGSEQGDDKGDGENVDSSQVWVHKLFRGKASDAANQEGIPPGDGGFLAGLDALIKGFTPD